MTFTRLLLLAAIAAVLLGCNPLDPSQIGKHEDAAVGCSPACSSTQRCLTTSGGGCSCFDSCDDSQCAQGSCVIDPTQGAVCVDLAQVKCQ